MKVITGVAKGKNLETLSGVDVRPTIQRIKEAVFSIIQFDIEGKVFLDLFAGSGQMGIEALSRGAASSFFIDSNKDSIKKIKGNLKSTNLCEKAVVVNADSLLFLEKSDHKFDIAFLDPPYNKGILGQAIKKLEPLMNPNGIIICEHGVEENFSNDLEKFSLKKEYTYGKIKISIYCEKEVLVN